MGPKTEIERECKYFVIRAEPRAVLCASQDYFGEGIATADFVCLMRLGK